MGSPTSYREKFLALCPEPCRSAFRRLREILSLHEPLCLQTCTPGPLACHLLTERTCLGIRHH